MKFPTKQILPVAVERTSLVVDNEYLTRLHVGVAGDDRIDYCFGSRKEYFNCVRFASCEVLNEYVRSMAVFAHTVIIEDSSFDCENLYLNIKNELEVRSGKIRFSTMTVEAKYVNIERSCLINGNQLIIQARVSASLSGGFELETQMCCRSQRISIDEHGSIATSHLLLLPAKCLVIRGALVSKKLFVGEFSEKLQKAVTGTARVEISGRMEGDKVSIMTNKDIVLSGSTLSVNEMDLSSGSEVSVKNCRMKVVKKLQVHAQTTKVDSVSVVEGTNFSFLIEEKVVLTNLSSFQFDGLLAIECRTLHVSGSDSDSDSDSEGSLLQEGTSTSLTLRCGDIYVSSADSIGLGGALKCKKLILKGENRATDVIIRGNANFDVDSLLVFGKCSSGDRDGDEDEGGGGGGDFGNIVFEGGSVVTCSKFIGVEADKDVIMKGSLKQGLCYSPPGLSMSINTSKVIKFVNCSVFVGGESQLLFGDQLVLEDGANLYVSGKLFMLHLLRQNNNAGILRIAKDCVLVARRDIVCQFRECYVEGIFASEEESVLLGHNNNQSPSTSIVPGSSTGKKVMKYNQVIKQVVRALKPSSKPLLSLLNKIKEKRIELIQNIQKIIHLREDDDTEPKSFVMEYIFISGQIRAKKTVMLVSRDISIQNGSSIKCTTSSWNSTAILMYSNRSVFQCSSELDASTVLIVSPIVFQLLSLIKAHNISISAAVVFRLACLCNSTKTILKSPLILSGLNVVAPNVRKTLHKMRSDLVESFVDVVLLIERLAEARIEHREFDVFLVESIKLFKKNTHVALLHSLELVHFVFQIVNMLIPKTALFITVNVMSIIRATMFLLFSVKNIRKSIKRYLTSERHNFILVEIVGEGLFSFYQVVGVVTNFTSLYNQLKKACSYGGNSSLSSDIPTLKDLPRIILHRTRDLVYSGPLSALSNVLGVFDTFVLNDYTKYAVGLFSYLPSGMSFSILNLSGELQLGMYAVISNSTCSLNGSVVVLSYNCSCTNIVSVSSQSNVVICNGSIYETSIIKKVDRGVKVSQRSLVLAGGRRVHERGFHFGESVVLKTKSFEQQNNRLLYSQIGGFSMMEWKLFKSEFRPVPSSTEEHRSSPKLRPNNNSASVFDLFDSDIIVKSVDESVIRSGNEIESVLVGDGSVFYLKDVALKIHTVSGAIIMMKNVHVKALDMHLDLKELSTLQITGGINSIVCDHDVDVDCSIHLAEGGHLNIISSSTTVDCTTNGEGHIAFHNAEIGENASIQHTGNTFIELKDDQRVCDAIAGSGVYSRISNDGRINFKVNGEFEIFSDDGKVFLSEKESSVRELQDIGIIAGSIEICRDVVRKKGIQLFSVEDDVVVRKSITSLDGSVVINAKNDVIVEDRVERGVIVTKCHLESKPSQRHISRMEKNVVVGPETSSSYVLTVVDGVDIVKKVEMVELIANESVFITANEGSIILDPCVIHGDERVVLEGKRGVCMKDICVVSVSAKSSRNLLYCKRKKVVKGVAATTKITSYGDISIIASEGAVVTSGVNLISSEGRILQSGRDGVINESALTEVFIKEKKRVLGGLSQEQRKEKHDIESPCVFESAKGIYVESEKGSIVNVGVLATGNGVGSFKAGENVLFERRILKHEVSVKKQGFHLSLSILGADIFQSSSTFFENLKLEFLENHLPPIGNSPVEVARSIKDGNVPEIAANLVNALLIPGNLRFIIDAPVKFGLKFNDYELHRHKYDSLGVGMIEMDYLYVNAADTVEFSNAFGFNAGSIEIEAHKLIEHGAFLKYELENFSSGIGFGFEPFGGNILQSVPSLSVDLSIAKESCSIAVCQVVNTEFMKLNVDQWDKYGSQTFCKTLQGRVGTISFDSTSTVAEGKMHGISLGTASLGLSDGHSKSSLIADQTGIYAVNVDDFHVKTVILKSSRCPVRGTDATIAEESMEFEKVSGTSLGVDFSGFLSINAMAIAAKNGGGKQISKLKGVGIEKKDYVAVVENSFENVNESDFHYRSIDLSSQSDNAEREAMSEVEAVHQNYKTLTRDDNSLFVKTEGESDEGAVVDKRSALLTPMKTVLKDKNFKLKIHYDRNYHLFHEGVEIMHKEVVDEGLLPCLDGAAFEDVDPQLLYPVLDIFFDPSTSDLDKYTQMLFYQDCEKTKFCDLTEIEKQEVFIYRSYLQDGGDFRDFISLCNFYEERKQSLSDEYAKKTMKEYVRETYPELYLSSGLHDVQNVDEVQRIFMDIKFAYEPDDPMVRQLTFEMDQYYSEQIFGASWAELSSTQQKEVVKIREHALVYQQTDQEVDFAEFVNAKEAQFVDYFANYHQEPDTNVLTSFGVLPIELLKDPSPVILECMPYQTHQFDDERKYPSPGSGLFFLLAAPEKGGWKGICEFGSTIKNCIRDHLFYFLAGRPKVDYQASQIEVLRDKSLRSFFSGVLDFIPFVNGAKWSYQGIAGVDPITKDHLDWKERVIDLTFSLFYFQPVANVILGYGKGAVLEPLKGAWMAGKIIVKDRTFKGVFETMKITGCAAIESISLPTQHLGVFLEIKMVWGVNNGVNSFRTASNWFSNKMENWKSGFWSKWKWSRRQFNVMTTTHFPYSVSGRDFALQGSSTTLSGNNIRGNHHMSMSTKGSGISSKVKKMGGESAEKAKGVVAKKGGSKEASKLRLRTITASLKFANRKLLTKFDKKNISKGLISVEMRNEVIINLITKEIYSKVLKWGGKAQKRRFLPRLKMDDYERIAKRFNAELSRTMGVEHPQLSKFTRTALQVMRVRIARSRDILRSVQNLSASNPRDGLSGLQYIQAIDQLPMEYTDFLVETIAKRVYSKLEKNTEIRILPSLNRSDYQDIAELINTKLRVSGNPRISSITRTAQQIKYFHSFRLNHVVKKVQEISSSNPQDGLFGLQSVDTRHYLSAEQMDYLVELIARKQYSKIFKVSDGSSSEIRILPYLNMSEYEKIAKRLNAELRARENRGMSKCISRSAKQVKLFHTQNVDSVVKKVREISSANPQDGLNGLESADVKRCLPEVQMTFLVELISRRMYEKLPRHHNDKSPNLLSVKDLRSIRLNTREYELISEVYHADPRVWESLKYRRSLSQIHRVFWKEETKLMILKNIQDMMRKDRKKMLMRKNEGAAPVSRQKMSQENSRYLVGIFAKKYLSKIPKHLDIGTLRPADLPDLTTVDYKEIVNLFNIHPRVETRGDMRTVNQVKSFAKRKRIGIVHLIHDLAVAMGRKVGSVVRSQTKVAGARLSLEYQQELLKEISKEMFNIIISKKSYDIEGNLVRIPKMTIDQWGTIAMRYNSSVRVQVNPKYARNIAQVRGFRRRHRKEVEKEISRLLHKELGIQVERFVVDSRFVPDEQLQSIIYEIFSKVIRKKLPKNCNLKELEVLPQMSNGDYELVTKLFNSDARVEKEFQMNVQQIMNQFRPHHKFKILKMLRGEQFNMKKYQRKGNKLPIQFCRIFIEDASVIIYGKIPENHFKIKGIAKIFKDLPKLEVSEYEAITKRYNDDPRVRHTFFEKPVEYFHRQVRYSSMWQREILRRVQEMCRVKLLKR